MKLLNTLSVILIFALSCTAQASSLDDLSIELPASKVKLPKRALVSLSQDGEGSDVFDRFEEGLDEANENPLRISNESGKIEVSVAGSSFKDGEKDAYNETKIVALEFSDEWQRYLISVKYEGIPVEDILINVDRKKKSARVHMRMRRSGKTSNWAEIVDYKP